MVIVDDCADVRFLLATVVELDGRFTVVAEAVDEPSALETVAAADPDLVLVDLYLDAGSGTSVVRELHDRHSTACIVVLTASTYPDDHEAAFAAGAAAVLDKRFVTSTMVDELAQLCDRHRFEVSRFKIA